MSYYDNSNGYKSKIPYDDIPINRNEKFSHGHTGRNSGVGENRDYGRRGPISIVFSIMIIVSFILSLVCVFLIKNNKIRTINQIQLSVGTEMEVSSAIKTSAYFNTVCVASGGSCNSETSFYNSTLSRGSGVIYKVIGNDIYFITCYHVVGGYENKVWVLMPSMLEPISVSVVAYSSHYDIAVLKYHSSDVEYTLGSCSPISPYESVYNSMGEKVFAVGNSLSCGLSITEGVISQTNTLIRIGSNSFWTRAMQTSAEINPGNSGGGLYNSNGKFIGLVNAKRHTAGSGSETYTVVGTAYAIPSTLVCGIADKMIANSGKPTYINLGATFGHDTDMGKTVEIIEHDGVYKQVETYSVVVDSVSAGSIAYSKLHSGETIESIEFYINENGVSKQKTVRMFNKYVFDEYMFSIVEGSTIRFHFKGGAYADVVATSIATVSD